MAPNNWRWRSDWVEPGPAVVFDVDGVLSDAAGRQHFLTRPKRDWDGFFAACGDDPVIGEVARLLEVLAANQRVVLLTGRPLRVQAQTLSWLQRNELRWDLLVMRDSGDYGAAREYKRRALRDLRSYGFDLRLAFEDDQRNRQMFHDEGIPCIYIHSGYFD